MAAEAHTGGMVALVPAAEYAVKLAVAGGLPAGDLHLTLCYLGDDVTTWPPEVVDAVQQAVLEITDPAASEGESVPAGLVQGPLALNVFAWSQFNPNGGTDGQEPCVVYQFSGDSDYAQVEALAGTVQYEMKEAVGEAYFPEQYCRFEPHVTAGYGLAPNALSYTGPVVFDRLRVALGDQITDLPLGGDGPMVAAAPIEVVGDIGTEIKVRFPVLALEGMDTGDGRFIDRNGLSHRALPISLLAQPYSSHGGQDAPPAEVFGNITTLASHDGPDVVSPRTGKPYGPDVRVWSGEGVIDGTHPFAKLVRQKFLRGISVDLADLDAELVDEETAAMSDHPRRQAIVHTAEIAAATMVPVPAFADAYVELVGEDPGPAVAASALPVGMWKQPVPMWRSVEVGDHWDTGSFQHGYVDPRLYKVPGIIPQWGDNRTSPLLAQTAPESLPLEDHGPESSVGTVSTNATDAGHHSQRSFAPTAAMSLSQDEASGEMFGATTAKLSGTVISRTNGPGADTKPIQNIGHGMTLPATGQVKPGSGDAASTPHSGAINSIQKNFNGNISTPFSPLKKVAARSAVWKSSSTSGGVPGGTRTWTTATSTTASGGGSAISATLDSDVSGTTQKLSETPSSTSLNAGVGSRSPRSRSKTATNVRLAAATRDLAPIEWFRNPELDGPTPLTVDDDGRVFGHLATWSQSHIGFTGRRVMPPRSHSDYAYFHVGATRVSDGSVPVTISAGHIALDTGHAGMDADYRAATAHYDNTGSLVADVCAGEDQHGIWIAGAVLPGIDDLKLHKLRSCGLSGDWRRIGAGLELVAAISVPTPGFPVPRARVASGVPMSMVAAGALVPDTTRSVGAMVDYDQLADVIADRILTRQQRSAALMSLKLDLLADLDDSPSRMAELLAEIPDEPGDFSLTAEDVAAFDIGRMPPQLRESYLHGKASAKIGWGTDGDFDRCIAEAIHHGIPGHMRKGMCATLHKEATGHPPGQH